MPPLRRGSHAPTSCSALGSSRIFGSGPWSNSRLAQTAGTSPRCSARRAAIEFLYARFAAFSTCSSERSRAAACLAAAMAATTSASSRSGGRKWKLVPAYRSATRSKSRRMMRSRGANDVRAAAE